MHSFYLYLFSVIYLLLKPVIYLFISSYIDSLLHDFRYDPPGTIIPPVEPSASQKPKQRPSITTQKCEEELDDHNKNAVQAILKRSRNFIVSALQRAKAHTTLTTDLISEMDKKASKGEGKEVKRGSLMSIQSSSTDISRVCSKELDDDWLGTYELMDILSDPSPMQSRRSSIDPQVAWSHIVGNNSSSSTPSVTAAAAGAGSTGGAGTGGAVVSSGANIKPEVPGIASADTAANSGKHATIYAFYSIQHRELFFFLFVSL